MVVNVKNDPYSRYIYQLAGFVFIQGTLKMYCDLCQTRKLRREFPSDAITDNCEHAPLHCLRVSAVILREHESLNTSWKKCMSYEGEITCQ